MISAFHLIYPFTFPSRVLLSLYLSNPSNPRFLFFLPTFYVINARKPPHSFFFLASLHLLWKKGGPLNVSLLLFPHSPSLSLPIRPIFLRSPFQRLFLRPSGVSSPIWINEPTLFPSSTSNCPSIRTRSWLASKRASRYMYIYVHRYARDTFPSSFWSFHFSLTF